MSLLAPRRQDDSLERWDAFRELDDVRQRMDRVFDEFMRHSPFARRGDAWAPFVDLEETDDAWIVEADVPGAERDDITVELHDDELAVHGEIQERERVGILRRRTRRTGQFDYRVRLPGDVDEDGIEAGLDNGVLTVRVPKGARARRRQIEIKGR